MNNRKKLLVTLAGIILIALSFITISCGNKTTVKAKKLYWFIPDGMRAEPGLFNIYKWAQEGKLPNIKKMIDEGSYGYAIPNFPSHTPANFAALLTGAYPEVNGVADGPMHTEGFPLDKPSVGGFNSAAKKVPPIWKTLETNGKKVSLLSIPGSTPPELEKGITIRGRWGGWGADVNSIIFEPTDNTQLRQDLGRSAKLFFLGQELTQFTERKKATSWQNPPKSFSQAYEAVIGSYKYPINIYVYDSTDDNKTNYDKVIFSKDKQKPLASLGEGGFSKWFPAKLTVAVPNKKTKKEDIFKFDSNIKFNVIKLRKNGSYRIKVFYDSINEYIVKPSQVAAEVRSEAGPMMDFPDNWPSQLIRYPEDKNTMLNEISQSLAWHKRANGYIIDKYNPDIFIQDTYTPNQMLESRWWLGYLDPKSSRYNDVDKKQRDKLWEEVKDMYKGLDDILGETIKNADENTLVVLSSDHGIIPLNKQVRLNNLFAKEGLLKFKINKETGEPIIDWKNTKAIFLKMDGIFIHPKGLAGNWKRGSGPEYEKLRNEVIGMLKNLKDEGVNPVAAVTKWEQAKEFHNLPPERVGDLVIANKPGYGWFEEMTENLEIFSKPLNAGYKQAVLADNEQGMWTPFIVMGPGVKKGYEIKKPLKLIDEYPTLMKLMGQKIPDFVQGKAQTQIME